MIQWINDAVANNYWLVISFHRIVTGAAGAYEYNVNNLETIVNYVAGQNIATPTISEVLNNELAPISWADATTKLKYIGNQDYNGHGFLPICGDRLSRIGGKNACRCRNNYSHGECR